MNTKGSSLSTSRESWMRARALCVALSILVTTSALARDAFVQALEPCIESLANSSAGDEPGQNRYHVVLGQSWMVSLFAVAEKDGGNLGSDMCGEIGSGWDLNGPYQWPTGLGELQQAVHLDMITAVWLDHIIRSARAVHNTSAPISRISITRLPEINMHLVRVAFAAAEAQAEAPDSIDMNQYGEVIARDTRVPDQFARIDAEPPQKVQAEAVLPATRAPLDALKLLLSATKAKPTAQILRLTLTNFDAGLVYRNRGDSNIRQTRFDYIDGEPINLADASFEFPPAFEACAMGLKQVQTAVANVVQKKRYQDTKVRLQYLLLECSKEKPKPHWSLVAQEPFEYFDLPGQIE
jgi:hypothetical protein